MSEQKYNSKYVYFNYLKKCPNCGATLKSRDKDCHACGINLVGYNDEKNRAHNLKKTAHEITQIADKHEHLNKQIKEINKNVIVTKKKKTKEELCVLFGKIFFVCLFLYFIISGIIHIVDRVTHDYKTYDDVVKYFEDYQSDTVAINVVSDTSSNFKKELSFENDGYSGKVEMYYNPDEKKTTIKESYQKENENILFERVFLNDILYAPEIDALWYVDFSSNLMPVHFNDEIFEAEYETTDEYILDIYVKDEDNLIQKYDIINIDGLLFHTYVIETTKEHSYHRFIAVAQIDDGVFFEATIMASHMDYIENVIKQPNKYFAMNYERRNINE